MSQLMEYTRVEIDGQVAGHAVEVIAAHRSNAVEPVQVWATIRVPLSADDIAAALWVSCPAPDEAAMVEDDIVLAWEIAADNLANIGGPDRDAARCDMDAARPGTIEGNHLARLRAVAARVLDMLTGAELAGAR